MALDTATGRKDVLLHSDRHVPMEATFSPDGRWVALTLNTAGRGRIRASSFRFQNRLAGEDAWIPVTEEIYHLALHWSPDGALIYYFSTRDDFRCIWGPAPGAGVQAADGEPVRRAPLSPIPGARDRRSWISVAQDKLAVTLSNLLANTWVFSTPAEP